MCMLPAEVKQSDIMPSCFSSYTVNKCPFSGIFTAMLFVIFLLSVGNFPLYNGPQAQWSSD